MKGSVICVRFLWCCALLFIGLLSTIASGQTLKEIAQFDLPGPLGKRFDYLTIDEDDHYLISAHLGAGQTYVIDLGTNKIVATIKNTPGAEGVEYVPELKKFYTSNAGDNTIGVVDLKLMKVVKKLPTEEIARNAGSKSHLAGSAMRPICQGLDRFPKRAIPTYDVAAC
jgi:hypothetical protein